MLYVLKKNTGPELYYLIRNKDYTIGRKGADIIISDDQSISRKHAIVKVLNNSVLLLDCGSKYGTKHNDSKLRPQAETVLQPNDVIYFGVFKSIFTFEKINVVTTGSGLSNAQKNELKDKIAAVGGSVLSNWDTTCTHITAQELMLTIKVLHALVGDIPIVTLEYWDRVASSIKNNNPMPEWSDFKPPISEALINGVNLAHNPARKELFRNKTFVFPTHKLKSRMAQLIEQTGGSSISWDKQPLTLSQVTKSKNKYLFIQSDDLKVAPQSLINVYEHLATLGERAIPLQEIASAIVMCSCEKDCNPKFNRLLNVFLDREVCMDTKVFLAGETPAEDIFIHDDVAPKQELVIPQSLDVDLGLTLLQQRSETNIPSNSLDGQCKTSSSFAGPSNISLGIFAPPITSSAVKRPEKEPEGTPCKKMKLSEEHQSQILVDNSRKRKSEDNLEPPSKKELRRNPFAIARNKAELKCGLKAENELRALQPLTNEITNCENPIIHIREKTEQRRQTSALELENTNFTSSNTFSQNYCPSDNTSIQWITKHDFKADKVEIKADLTDIYDMFRNSVVLQVLPPTALRSPNCSRLSNTINSTAGGKNFKKFRKVLPLRPQINIITTSILSTKRTNQISILSDGEEDEEDIPRTS